ncbi:MAG: cytochrome c biogenesis protein ResB, partial [Nitrospirota bacterium]
WNFFASVKLTIVILIILALSSIIGTILPQQATYDKNIEFLAGFSGVEGAPTVYNLLIKLDFFDMYHSWWFIVLLVLFSVNLIICSLERFPKTLRFVNTPLKPLEEKVLKTLPVKKELNVRASLNTAKDEVLNSFSASGYTVFSATGGEETGGNYVQLYSQKGKFSRFGLYIVHLSILLILIGAIMGARLGFSGYLNLPEGEASDVAYTSGGKTIPLGFTVKCNWYNTEYYSGIDTPQDFRSELVVIDGGREVIKKVIEVNNPLTYRGITFYQSSYGVIPDAVGKFMLKLIPKNGEEKTIELKIGESFTIPGTNIMGTIVKFSPALTRDPQTGALATYSDSLVNPAVAIEFDETGKGKFTGWILKRYPETGIMPDGNRIIFTDYWGVEYTGLQVAKDPGKWLIYFAFAVMTIGLYVAFFMSHKKIWITVAPETSGGKSFVRITAGGSAGKNKLSLDRELEKILSKASHTIEGGAKNE